MKTPLRSLRFRLIGSVVLIEVIMLSMLVWNNQLVIRQAHTDRLSDTATSMLQQISRTAGSYMAEVDYASLQEYLANVMRHTELAYLLVLDRDGETVIRLGDRAPADLPVQDRHPASVDDAMFDVSRGIDIGDHPMGKVYMGFSLDNMERAIAGARVRSVVIAVAGIALTILATVWIGLHLTRRLGSLAQAAQRVGAGDYSTSVPVGTRDEVGTTAEAFNAMVDEVSQRTRHLEESLARERVIEETSIDGMVTYTGDCTIASVNPAMQTLFGYAARELVGRQVSCLLAPVFERRDAGPDRMDPRQWTRASTARRELTGRRKDGSCFPMEVFIGSVDIGGQPLYAATLHDITERKLAENECKSLLAGNRFLIHKSLVVQEEERRHLARELHDELGQCMTAIQADAGIIQDLASGHDEKVSTSARAISDVSSRMYDVVHSMMQRLRPGVLDDLGLVAAIEEEIGNWQTRHPAIQCKLVRHGELDALGERVNITLYRVVQESLTNIAKHARASEVNVSLENTGESLRLGIDDNGQGIPNPGDTRGLGLIGMRERIEAVGGEFSIESAPGRGVCIDVLIPLREIPA